MTFDENSQAVEAPAVPAILPAAAVVPALTTQEWADRILRAARKTVEAVITLGGELHAAKHALPHGEWLKMFKGHPQAVQNPVRFSEATARMFMAIAAHPVLSNRYLGNDLPSSWRTLFQLTQLPDAKLIQFIKDGWINPQMTRKHAENLCANVLIEEALARGIEPPGQTKYTENNGQPWKTLIMHFACRADLEDLYARMGLSLSTITRDVWYPPKHVHVCECGHTHEDQRTTRR